MLGLYLVVVFGGMILISFLLSRDRGTKHGTHHSFKVGRGSMGGKIHRALVDDSVIFDGEAQEYAESMSRIRQLGGG